MDCSGQCRARRGRNHAGHMLSATGRFWRSASWNLVPSLFTNRCSKNLDNVQGQKDPSCLLLRCRQSPPIHASSRTRLGLSRNHHITRTLSVYPRSPPMAHIVEIMPQRPRHPTVKMNNINYLSKARSPNILARRPSRRLHHRRLLRPHQSYSPATKPYLPSHSFEDWNR